MTVLSNFRGDISDTLEGDHQLVIAVFLSYFIINLTLVNERCGERTD